MENETLEQETKRLRDLIFLDSHGPLSAEKWNALKEGWMADIMWLRKKANEPLKLFGEVIINKDNKEEIKDALKIKEDKKDNIVEKVC